MAMVTKLYETEGQASGAHGALLENGFSPDVTALLTPELKDWKVAMTAGAMLGEHAEFYADQVSQGYSLVVANPPFGFAVMALNILNEYTPLDITHEPPAEPYVPWTDKPAAFSSLLGLPTLTRDDTTFSGFWGLPTKSDRLSPLSRLIPELAPAYTFSGKIGMKTKTDNPTPLSKLIGMSTESKRLQGKSSSFGISLLSGGGTPFSSTFRIPLLTKRKRFLSE